MTECSTQVMQYLASMPLLDRLDLATVSGWSIGAIYENVERLEGNGIVGSIPHATELAPPTRRYQLNADGLERLAQQECTTVEQLLLSRPVSSQWQRILLQRLDTVAVVYRIASILANIAHPIRFQWYRAGPLDATVTLPGGPTVGVIRQGLTSSRTSFAKRLRRLWQGTLPDALCLLVPDEVRLHHTRRLLSDAPIAVFLALDRDVVRADPTSRLWRIPQAFQALPLQDALKCAGFASLSPVEKRPVRFSLPEDIQVEDVGQCPPDHLLPALLKITEKRALGLLSDWVWLPPDQLGDLLEVKRSRLYLVLQRVRELGLTVTTFWKGSPYLALSDRGLDLLARRDRTDVVAFRRRWSVTPRNPRAPYDWRNVSGSGARHLLREMNHTQAVHRFISNLVRQAGDLEWEVTQLDPPHRASRYFRHDDRLYSVRPDAFGILQRAKILRPFFLEWERRAVRPVTMAGRIAPYLRYFATSRPIRDHGVLPAVMVAFEDHEVSVRFLEVAGAEMDRARVEVPLWVSHCGLLDEVGPLGPAWCSLGRSDPTQAFS